ncbi:hypothetical protein PILCRDRAFT_819196 [Piloderma croceum F 1598]|uniref:CsbD-like domain-containing protein n=1 Tax=Piloderma croceum (strain F 1598) TaxID=765440 RepID=A0A0C3FGT8_PILCF|nr:hypothetical protein PILCRDRAFT_819196 [Piloderma croceum F 1598]
MSDNTNSTEPSKATGQYHSLKGTVVEAVGDVSGSTSWKNSGKEEHAAGEAEYNAAQAKQYVEGVSDRVTGYKDSVVGAIVGDKSQQATGNIRKEAGATQQKANAPST